MTSSVSRAARQQVGQRGDLAGELLEVVEHQQVTPPPDTSPDGPRGGVGPFKRARRTRGLPDAPPSGRKTGSRSAARVRGHEKDGQENPEPGPAEQHARIRVLQEGRTVLEINHLQPGAELATARTTLGAYALELAVAPTARRSPAASAATSPTTPCRSCCR